MPGPVSLADAVRDHIRAAALLLDRGLPALEAIAARISACLRGGGTLYLCGNGGSAADCQHVAAEFVGRFLRERRPLPAVALTTDTSALTAIGNDYGFEQVFARAVAALAKPGDVVAGISTSGRSPNVLAALREAHAVGATTIGFTGEAASPMDELCDLIFRAPSAHTPRIQEMHLLGWHLICDQVEAAIMLPDSGTLRHAA